jgi:hypothetical protein
VLSTITKGTVDLNHAVPELTAGSGESTIDLAVDEEGAAEHLAGIDRGKILLAAAGPEPSVPNKQGTRVMIDNNGKREAFL